MSFASARCGSTRAISFALACVVAWLPALPTSAQDEAPRIEASSSASADLGTPEAVEPVVDVELPSRTSRGSMGRRRLIAAGEELLALGVGVTWYWLDRERNVADWDIDSIEQRFSVDSIRFDSNAFPINWLWHPLSGAAYYGLPRANGLSLAGSAGYAFVTTLVWEYGLEFREKVSINDVITTPITGIATGEFLSRLALYLNRAPGGSTRRQRAFGWLLGATQAMHDLGYRDAQSSADVPRDSLGYDARIAHRFLASIGVAYMTPRELDLTSGATLDLEGELFAMPGYLTADRIRRGFADANRSSMSLRTVIGGDVFGIELRADAILFGFHEQHMRGGEGERRGHAITVGSHLAYLYRRDELPGFTDALGATGLPGLALEVDVVRPRLRFHLGGRLEGQFAGVHASAHESWAAANPGLRTKTVLRRYDYFYGWGLGARIAATLEIPHLALEAGVFHGRYRSQEGLDRNQEAVTADVAAHDRALDLELRLRVRPSLRRGLFLEAAALRRLRHEVLGGFESSQRLDRFALSLGTYR